MSSLRKGNAHSCKLRQVNGCRCWVECYGAVAGHIKRAAALNAWTVSTGSTLNLWHHAHTPHMSIFLCMTKPPSLPEKTCFLRGFRTRLPACVGHADRGGPRRCILRSTVRSCLGRRVYCGEYIVGSGSVAPHPPARFSACHHLRDSRPNVFIFWRKSPRQASKVAFSLDKATMKV